VGKTETARALADILYGGERNLTVINMSEYQEAYTVSGLKGSPPGYVGHGKGGVLTEAVRRRPYSVVLLDEVEKAHPDVMELFYQVFDKGTLEDSEGVPVDFRNTILLLTSNVASEILLERCANPRNRPSAELVLDWIRPELQTHFRPAFLGRLVVVPYFPLDVDTIREIVELQMRKIQARFLENHRLPLTYSDELAAEIAMRCTRADTGARNVDNILTHHLLPDLSGELLRRMAEGRPGAAVHVGMDGAGDFVYRFDEPASAGGERPSEPAAPNVPEKPPEPEPAAPKAPEKPPKPKPAEPDPVSVEEWRAAQADALPEFLRKPVRRTGGKIGGEVEERPEAKPEAKTDEKIGGDFTSPPPREEDAPGPPHPPPFRETDSEPAEVDPEFGGTVPRFFIEGPQNEADDDESPEPRPKRRQGRGWLGTLFKR
jgi:hypothetical protein